MAEGDAKARSSSTNATAKGRTTVTKRDADNGRALTAVSTKEAVSSDQAAETNEKGRTTIADVVVAKIAGMAAREIPGIYELGGGAARAFRAIRERVPGAGKASVAQGVSVEVGERQAAVDLVLVVEYGISIADVAQAARENVIDAVERMTGLEVVEVNISIDDIHLPELDGDNGDEIRVGGRNLE